MTGPTGEQRPSKGQMLLALAFLVLAWSSTAAFTWVAIEVRARRSVGLEGQYLLMIAGPLWAAAVVAAGNCVLLYRWRWLSIVYGALAIGAPAFVFLHGCVAFAEWWLP